MQKYSDELKLKIVLEHQRTGLGEKSLENKYGVNHSLIQIWIRQYKTYGRFIKPKFNFSGEFKLKVLNYQMEHHLSDLDTAIKFEISSKSTIALWRKQFLTGGKDGLFSKRGKIQMPKKSLIPNKPREEWTEQEELAYLRMENEVLKKLNALIQEREQREDDLKKKKKSKSLKN